MRPLAGLRTGIDALDDGLIALVAVRRVLVGRVGRLKSRAGLPVRDAARERDVHARAHALARRLGVPAGTAQRVMDAVIHDARTQQQVAADLGQGAAVPSARMIAPAMRTADTRSHRLAQLCLRLLPPPSRWAPLVAMLPAPAQQRALERAVAAVLGPLLSRGELEFMRGRRLGIEVTDLRLLWTLELEGDRLRATDEAPEACVRGTATDLLLLASRLEDADTLFFQRRLTLVGDTELGLTVRNVLDRLPWESVPLAVRIALNRAARVAREARAVHHATH